MKTDSESLEQQSLSFSVKLAWPVPSNSIKTADMVDKNLQHLFDRFTTPISGEAIDLISHILSEAQAAAFTAFTHVSGALDRDSGHAHRVCCMKIKKEKHAKQPV